MKLLMLKENIFSKEPLPQKSEIKISYYNDFIINLFKVNKKKILGCFEARSDVLTANIKRATKLYFMHYSCVVIILFNMDLFKSAFSTYSFKNLAFRLPVFFIFCLFCFELDVIFIDL